MYDGGTGERQRDGSARNASTGWIGAGYSDYAVPVRRAVLGAAEQSRPVQDVDLEQAVYSLLVDGDTLTRALLGAGRDWDDED